MGLDMYAYSLPAEAAGTQQVDVSATSRDIEHREIAYWRKFNHLHGWMEKLYTAKGGQQEFNCTTVRLDPEDLDALALAIKNKALEHTDGFFFGGSDIWPEDIEKTEAFIVDARAEIAAGSVVLYSSWW